MKIEFDPAKSEKNEKERGLPFLLIAEFDWETARFGRDRRRDYGEPRFKALGYLMGWLHVVIFTPKPGGIRVISLRKANRREEKDYEEAR